MLAERRLNASQAIESNRVAKDLSRAFCGQIERERLRWAKKWHFCGANDEKTFLGTGETLRLIAVQKSFGNSFENNSVGLRSKQSNDQRNTRHRRRHEEKHGEHSFSQQESNDER